jgi:hypothetical protein
MCRLAKTLGGKALALCPPSPEALLASLAQKHHPQPHRSPYRQHQPCEQLSPPPVLPQA